MNVPMIQLACLAVVAATPPGVTSGPSPFEEIVGPIRSESQAGRAAHAARRLTRLAEAIQVRQSPPAERAEAVRAGLAAALWSPVEKDHRVRSTAATLALAALSITTANGEPASPELLTPQLIIALEALPRTSASSDQIAEGSLRTWRSLLASLDHYGAVSDRLRAALHVEIQNPPPTRGETFVFGQDPLAVKDPLCRQWYLRCLQLRDQYALSNSNSSKLSKLRDRFRPALHTVLRAAYAGDATRRKIGTAQMEKHVADPETRRELRDAIHTTGP